MADSDSRSQDEFGLSTVTILRIFPPPVFNAEPKLQALFELTALLFLAIQNASDRIANVSFRLAGTAIEAAISGFNGRDVFSRPAFFIFANQKEEV